MSKCASWKLDRRTIALLTIAALTTTLCTSVQAQQGMAPRMDPISNSRQKKRANRGPATRIEVRNKNNQGFDSFNIVAVVDDQVILLEDIIATIRPDLEMRKKQLPPAEYKKYERQRIEQATQGRIQQTIVLNELRKKIPNEDAINRIRANADADFERHINRMVHQNKLENREQLIELLEREGGDIEVFHQNFIDNLIAQTFLNTLVRPKVREPSRLEMESYYREHITEFEEQAGAIWRNIEIKKGSDPNGARQKIEGIRQQLVAGADFEELAKKHSQGPTAAAGGLWSRTSPGSFADTAVDKAIFSIEIGQVSPVVEGAKSYHLILVEERSNGDPTPFVDVQNEIRQKLESQQMVKLRRELVDELGASHHVTSVFDNERTMQLASPQEVSTTR